MRLGIGSAQFGLDYGIANRTGMVAREEVARILATAAEEGVEVVDTAPLYGEAEAVLGALLPREHRFRLVTKTPSFADTPPGDAPERLDGCFRRSLSRLRQSSVHGLLVHHAEDLLRPGGEALFEAMTALRRAGLVNAVGVSTYSPEQVDRVLDRFSIDLIQVPLNVLDQRLLAGGQIARLARAGVEIHARSVFLQGLLTLPPERLPAHFDAVRPVLVRYRARLAEHGRDAVSGAAGFVAGIPGVACAVFGVDTADQVRALRAAVSQPLPPEALRDIAVSDPSIIDPTRWPSRCALCA